MQFIVKAYDDAGMLDKRLEVRPQHLEGMKALGSRSSAPEVFSMREERLSSP